MKKMLKKKREGSKADKAMDKKMGYKEGSKKDEALDNKMARKKKRATKTIEHSSLVKKVKGTKLERVMKRFSKHG